MKFALYDQSGMIRSTGRCPDGEEVNQVTPGLMLYIGEAEMHDSVDVTTGKLIRGAPPPPTYREKRRREYPPVEAQLEALWHGMDRGEIPVSPEFYEMIAAVRERHPNPDAFKSVEY